MLECLPELVVVRPLCAGYAVYEGVGALAGAELFSTVDGAAPVSYGREDTTSSFVAEISLDDVGFGSRVGVLVFIGISVTIDDTTSLSYDAEEDVSSPVAVGLLDGSGSG